MKFIGVLGVFIFNSSVGYAERIQEVTVRGHAEPFANQTVTKETIQKRHYRSIQSLVTMHPSLSLKDAGGKKSVMIRGAGSSHAIVILDGMVLNDPSSPGNVFDLNGIDLDMIESSELVVGPKAGFYGNGGLGGVLILKSKQIQPHEKKARARVEGGTQGHNGQSIQGGVATETLAGFLSIGRSEEGLTQRSNPTHNISNSDYTSTELGSVMLSLKAHENHKMRLIAHGHRRFEYIDRYDDNGLFIHAGDYQTLRGFKVALINDFQVTDDYLTQVSINHVANTRTTIDTMHSHYAGRRTGIDWNNEWLATSQVKLDFGINLQRDSDDFRTTISSVPHRNIIETGYRLRGTYDMTDQTSLYMSGRYDTHSQYKNIATWQAGLHQEFPRHVILELNIGTSFKYPSITTLYGSPPYQNPNPDATPERGFSTDVSLQKNIPDWGLTLKGTFFYLNIRDVLAWDSPNRRVHNLARRVSQGAEFEASGELGDQIQWRMAYTYTDAKDQQTETATFTKALDLADHKYVLGIDYLAKTDLNFFLEAIHYSKKKDYSGVTVGPTTDLRIGFTCDINDNIQFKARVENGLNETTETVCSYGRRPIAVIFGLTVKT